MNDTERHLQSLDRQIALLRLMVYLLAFICGWFTGRASGGDVSDAIADRATFAAESWPLVYYVTTETLPESDREDLIAGINLAVASTSTQPILERSIPERITPTLLRLRLDELFWSPPTWRTIVSRDPYSESSNPLVVRGDWLLAELTDAHASPAYYDLLFGKRRTRDQVLALMEVDANPEHRVGLIEGESGVAVQGMRWIENRPRPRGYAWLTRDSIELTGERDMLEHPDGAFRHDGEEIIIGIRKVHIRSGTMGALQVYLLANGGGELVGRAPVDLVVDKTRFRGLSEIRAPGSCIQCHAGGLNEFKKNELRSYLEAGVELDATQDVEAFHLQNLETERLRDSSDFTTIVELATGLDSEATAAAFRRATGRYHADLTIDQAATELQTTPRELRLALAWRSATGKRLTARLSGLAHGQTIPRAAFAESYLAAKTILANWEASQ